MTHKAPNPPPLGDEPPEPPRAPPQPTSNVPIEPPHRFFLPEGEPSLSEYKRLLKIASLVSRSDYEEVWCINLLERMDYVWECHLTPLEHREANDYARLLVEKWI